MLFMLYSDGVVQRVCVSDIENITQEEGKTLVWCKVDSVHEGQIYCVEKVKFSWLP